MRRFFALLKINYLRCLFALLWEIFLLFSVKSVLSSLRRPSDQIKIFYWTFSALLWKTLWTYLRTPIGVLWNAFLVFYGKVYWSSSGDLLVICDKTFWTSLKFVLLFYGKTLWKTFWSSIKYSLVFSGSIFWSFMEDILGWHFDINVNILVFYCKTFWSFWKLLLFYIRRQLVLL